MGGLLGSLAVAGDVSTQPLRVGALCYLSGFLFKSPEPKDWSAKRRFKAAKKSSKPPALFASMLKRI